MSSLTSRFPRALLAAAALSLGGCPLLEVQVEVTEVCITYAGTVDGAPGLTSIDTELGFEDLGALGALAGLDAELRFVRAEIRPTSGIAAIDFVSSAEITIASGDPASTLPTVAAFACAGEACRLDGAAVEVPAGFQDDAVAYLRSGSIVAGVRMTGAPPPTAWGIEVDLCVEGKVSAVR